MAAMASCLGINSFQRLIFYNIKIGTTMIDKPYIRISPDIDTLYDDAEGCCYLAYGDEISISDPSLGPCFYFVVPGIEEWVTRYTMATDFAETTTDPSFNWEAWHYEGLCFAKAIWEKLPRCYTLYYESPYEDKSGTIGTVTIDANIDRLIDKFHGHACDDVPQVAIKDNIEYNVERQEDKLKILFRINKLEMETSILFNRLEGIHHWLKQITECDGTDKVCSVQLSDFDFHFEHQTVGIHQEMGRFWISKSDAYNGEFHAYVNSKEFVRSFNLALMEQ